MINISKVVVYMAQDKAESTRAPISYRSFINQFPLDTKESIWQLERTYTKNA